MNQNLVNPGEPDGTASVLARTRRRARLTGCVLPERVQLGHEDRVLQLPEEPLEDVGHVLDEVLSDPQLHVPGVSAELVHQDLDPGLGPVLPVDALMAQT